MHRSATLAEATARATAHLPEPIIVMDADGRGHPDGYILLYSKPSPDITASVQSAYATIHQTKDK